MKDEDKRKTANRVNQLEHLIENFTRTERHLEQHSDIIRDEQMINTARIQSVRKDEINSLEDALIHGVGLNRESDNDDNSRNQPVQDDKGDLENLKINYDYTENFLAEHAEEMDPETIEKVKHKQAHRISLMEKFSQENKNEQ